MVKTDFFTLESILDALPPDVKNRTETAQKILENLTRINDEMNRRFGPEVEK